jgi:hypothetical protein
LIYSSLFTRIIVALRGLKNFNTFIYKFTRYEFWPWYLIFLPLLPIYVYGVIRTRKLLYFTAANPSIDMGGFFGERKDEILALIPNEYKASSINVTNGLTLDLAKKVLAENNLQLPLILKPNVGERGNGVRLIHTLEDMVSYAANESEFLIQEYIDYPLELGILYSRMPSEQMGIVSSMAEKEFLRVKGDGVSTVGELLQSTPRNNIYYPLVASDYTERLAIVPALEEDFIVHRIGNHIKGTRFIDANKHITKELNQVFTTLSNELTGVFYGRYDLKVPSYKDLQAGKNIKIFELNGVSSEPGHIYDQNTVFTAYYDLAEHWLRLIAISHQNIKKGVKTTPLSKFLLQVKNHFFG